MTLALFLGCNIPARVKQYELSSRAVLATLGVKLVDIREFNCCGYPMRNLDFKTFILSSARNIALSEQQGLNMITPCKCCYGSLKKADHMLKKDSLLSEEINGLLSREGLEYKGNIEIKHLLSVLYHDVGIDKIKEHVDKPYKDLKIASHYGCHALRPSQVVQFDDPVSPTLFDKLVEATGAESIYWRTRLECCGAPLLGVNDDLSMNITKKKLTDGKQSGADFMCTACPYCQLQFETVFMNGQKNNGKFGLQPVLYTQLLGLCMGIERDRLGIQATQADLDTLEVHQS
jgi:heterodisulfide reductase subunit B